MDLASRSREAASALASGSHPIGCLRKVKPDSSSTSDTMSAWRSYRDATRRTVLQTYQILGFLSSGTYGRVYKACLRNGEKGSASKMTDGQGEGKLFAIKKFKPDKESEAHTYTGISQSAMREIALNSELRHENIVTLREVVLEDRSIYMVFAYASHDFLQLIHHHSSHLRTPVPGAVLKSLLFQLLSGVHYLHSNWVLHRDLKPANILLTSNGVVKIGDLGLARLYSAPLQPLYNGDKVVVTIWYRAPELLMGTRHYTTAIDMWAIGCIWGEVLGLRPLFKGEEAKADGKQKGSTSSSLLQTDQMARIIEVLGTPTPANWPSIESMPDYRGYWQAMRFPMDTHQNVLYQWYTSRFRSQSGFALLQSLLQYDPGKRKSAKEALDDPWFKEEPLPTKNAFASLPNPAGVYPQRRLHSDTTDPVMAVDPVQAAHEQQRQQQKQQQQQQREQLQREQQLQAQQQQQQQQLQQKAQQTQTQTQTHHLAPVPPPLGGSYAPAGPAAPAPAPASVGSLPNSVGPGSAGPTGGTTGAAALGISASGFTTNTNAATLAGNLGLGLGGLGVGVGMGMEVKKSSTVGGGGGGGGGGMVATAAANASRDREQANKRARMG